MKDGIVIKSMWLLMGSAMKVSLPVLGVSNPKAFWKESKKIYRREMDKLAEYGPNDILKINLAPAMCAIDYLFGECSNHWFLRESTIAVGGEVCDCRYVSKRAATQGEICRSKENKKSEAIRGGRKEL